jgi:hypothetical protein
MLKSRRREEDQPGCVALPRQLTIAALRVERGDSRALYYGDDSMDGLETGWTEPHLTESRRT